MLAQAAHRFRNRSRRFHSIAGAVLALRHGSIDRLRMNSSLLILKKFLVLSGPSGALLPDPGEASHDRPIAGRAGP